MRTIALRLPAACLCFGSVLAFAACGGGSNTMMPQAAASATPAPPPTPTPSPYPTGDGSTFAYQGTYTQQYTLYATPAPNPSPGATVAADVRTAGLGGE